MDFHSHRGPVELEKIVANGVHEKKRVFARAALCEF